MRRGECDKLAILLYLLLLLLRHHVDVLVLKWMECWVIKQKKKIFFALSHRSDRHTNIISFSSAKEPSAFIAFYDLWIILFYLFLSNRLSTGTDSSVATEEETWWRRQRGQASSCDAHVLRRARRSFVESESTVVDAIQDNTSGWSDKKSRSDVVLIA